MLEIKRERFLYFQCLTIIYKLFNLMMWFEYVSNSFGKSIFVPIPKDETSCVKTTVDSYRGISITPVVSKVFELCLLEIFSTYLKLSDNFQYGLKSKTSCSNALYCL